MSKAIAGVLQKAYAPGSAYYEPFVGGGHVLYRVADFIDGPMYVSDINKDLMLLWRAVADGFQPPTQLTREEWRALKTAADPSPLRSAAGFGLSFSGVWFKGYGGADRPRGHQYPCRALARSFDLRRDVLARSTLACCSFDEYVTCPRDDGSGRVIEKGSLVYCDPPYANTSGYVNVEKFDHPAFWAWATEMSKHGAKVFVSELEAPPGWAAVLEKQGALRIKTVKSQSDSHIQVTEKLFRYEG